MRLILPLVLSSVAALAACEMPAGSVASDGSSAGNTPATGPGRVATLAERLQVCRASGLTGLVGQSWPQPIPSGITHRVLEPGGVMTMDYRSDRLNIQLTSDGRRIDTLYCG